MSLDFVIYKKMYFQQCNFLIFLAAFAGSMSFKALSIFIQFVENVYDLQIILRRKK